MLTQGLAGKVAVVAGASSSIGQAISVALADAGGKVHAVGRRRARLEEIAGHTRGTIECHEVDLTDESSVARLLSRVGDVDILVNNAACPPELAPFLKGGMPVLRSVMELNFFSAARLCLGLLPQMCERRWGRIINISSLAGSLGEAYGPGYSASKAALEGFSRSLAIDYSPHGVTVNVVAPGPVMTERFAHFGPTKARRFATATSVRRLGEPADIAHAVTFLASPSASYVTGETLRVDGGLHLGNPLSAMYIREAGDGKAKD